VLLQAGAGGSPGRGGMVARNRNRDPDKSRLTPWPLSLRAAFCRVSQRSEAGAKFA